MAEDGGMGKSDLHMREVFFGKWSYRLAATDRCLLCGRISCRDPRLGKQGGLCRDIDIEWTNEKVDPLDQIYAAKSDR